MLRFVLVAVIALSLAPQLRAQESVPQAFAQLRPGQTLRIYTAQGRRHEGRYAGLAWEPPSLSFREQVGPVVLTDIDSLWVRRSGARKGAVIGGLALGIPSAAFWAWACTVGSEGRCRAWHLVAGLTVAGAAVGAGVGAAIGSASVRWQLRYVRSPSRDATRLPSADRALLTVSIPLPLNSRSARAP